MGQKKQAKKLDFKGYWILLETCLLLPSCGLNYFIFSLVRLVNKILQFIFVLAKDMLIFSFVYLFV